MSQYEFISKARVSQNCEAAARDYYALAQAALLEGHEDSMDLLRILVRPIYYLGISDSESVYAYIQSFASGEFMNWLKSNMRFLEHCLSVLGRCNELEIEGRESGKFLVNGKEFTDIPALRRYLEEFFSDLCVGELELERIIQEEMRITA